VELRLAKSRAETAIAIANSHLLENNKHSESRHP
jgi:hypothetical protein